MHCVHLVVRGRVQGVGFRYFVVLRAQALGAAGWVRNRADGAVELEAEGPIATLERLLEAARSGPPGARVVGVDEEWSERPPQYRGFRISG
jgi:acylphosphatase